MRNRRDHRRGPAARPSARRRPGWARRAVRRRTTESAHHVPTCAPDPDLPKPWWRWCRLATAGATCAHDLDSRRADNARFGPTGPQVGRFDGGYGASDMARIVAEEGAEIGSCRKSTRSRRDGLVTASCHERLEAETCVVPEMRANSPPRCAGSSGLTPTATGRRDAGACRHATRSTLARNGGGKDRHMKNASTTSGSSSGCPERPRAPRGMSEPVDSRRARDAPDGTCFARRAAKLRDARHYDEGAIERLAAT